MLKKFAAELKEQREKAGISLQNIAAKTRIDIKFLEALEDGSFNFLPEIYVKAFVKQYAKVIGLDEEETLEKYILAKAGREENVEKINQEISDEKKDDTNDRKTQPGVKVNKPAKIFSDENLRKKSDVDDKNKQKQIFVAISAIGAVLLVVLIYFVFFNNGNDIIVEEKPYEEVLQETPKRYIEEEKEEKNQPIEEKKQVKIEVITLTVTNVDSTDSAWVMVMVDNKSIDDFLLLPKISKKLKANNNFYFTLGNSGVVKLSLNGKELEFNGKRGAIRYFKLDANGLERVYAPPKLNNE